ncbi:MAG: class I SAM-dependent methyltransferase [Candidatus Hydrogenedentes bacterium]|nr:class I SAM-dependent methyltransferase [Candidatus Hydrogenedentota bacterium]
MKTRESGMPEESMWEQFFDPPAILAKLGVSHLIRDVAEFGCGYGTFTIPVARMVSGTVCAFDIDRDMIQSTQEKVRREGLRNVRLHMRDFVAEGTGLVEASVDLAMLFNILHAERPHVLLQEAYRILRSPGTLAIIHWNYDPTTPRGPSMEIRPKPERCLAWAAEAGFIALTSRPVDLPPYHYGLILAR